MWCVCVEKKGENKKGLKGGFCKEMIYYIKRPYVYRIVQFVQFTCHANSCISLFFLPCNVFSILFCIRLFSLAFWGFFIFTVFFPIQFLNWVIKTKLFNWILSTEYSSSSSSCSWRVRRVILFLDPQDEVGPSISSSVVLCFFVLLVYIVVLVLVICLCPSSVHAVATFPGTVLFPLLCSLLQFFA